MRLWGCIPLSLLAVASVVLSSQASWELQYSVKSTTLIDVLNSDEDYTLLLSLLQRARLIPTLNRLNVSTFFAPTNDAVKRHSDKNSFIRRILEDDKVPDNIQEKLRQQLLYHLVDHTITTTPEESTTQILKTLHFPNFPTNSSRSTSPWLGKPKSTLGGEPQRLRLTSRDNSLWVGTDASGRGGVQVVKDRVEATNGVVLGVSNMLEVPPALSQVIAEQESMSYLKKILTPGLERFLDTTSELTLFLPLDSAWKSLDPLERLYLESRFSEHDRRQILGMHLVRDKDVQWSESFKASTKFKTEYGSVLDIVVSSEGTMISGSHLMQPDIYASNGVLHLVSSLLIPPGALRWTPEKYLFALNCTIFVSKLHTVGLAHLINNPDQQYTILVPKDDVLSLIGLPETGTAELKRMLQYHFIPGIWTPKKVDNGLLLETELHERGLDNKRQVLQVEVQDNDKLTDDSKHIAFGGAGVIGEYVERENTVIYFISRFLDPPVDPLQTALPSLDLSSFLAAVFSTSLADAIKTTPRTTFLIPRNNAFKRLGRLVSDHLLAASSKADLEKVIMHHIIHSVEYSKDLAEGSQRTFATLEGSDLQLERAKNGSIVVRASGGWTGMIGALYLQNTLTETGVIHEISDLMIPRSVELTVGKLMKAAKATTMTSMIIKAGLEWVLDGTAPPKDSEWAGQGVSWIVLCPADDAFKKFDPKQLFDEPEILRAIVGQHLIPVPPSSSGPSTLDLPSNNRPLPLAKLGTYPTLQSLTSIYGDLVFRLLEDKDKTDSGYMVGIKDARGTDGKTHWALVLEWGKTTNNGGMGGVIQIDRLLLPYTPPWWIRYSTLTVLGVLAVCLGGMAYVLRRFWKRDTEATYEPVGGFAAEED